MPSSAGTAPCSSRAEFNVCGSSWNIVDMIEFGPPTVSTTVLIVIIQIRGYDDVNQTIPVVLPPGELEEVIVQRVSQENQPCASPVIYNVPRYLRRRQREAESRSGS